MNGQPPLKSVLLYWVLTLSNLLPYRPHNHQELYNLRHASARNVVERIFGVVKRRFRLMVIAPEYSLQKQARLVHALCVLHNFIRVHDPDDLDTTIEEELTRIPEPPEQGDFGGSISAAEKEAATSRRDNIAKQMWADYVEYLETRH